MRTLKKYLFTPILGWSVSRYDKFVMCKRQYYYTYYAKFDRSVPGHKIEKLKKLTSIPLEIGNIIHDLNKIFLERLLKSEKEIDQVRFFSYARKMTEEYCNSKEFAERYYGQVESVNIEEIFVRVQKALTNFLDSDRFNWIMKKAIVSKSDWIIEPPGYGETRIGALKAYCKVDFLFPLGEKMYIIDWKTGKPNEIKHRKQLIGYTLWASNLFDKKSNEIVPIIVHLLPGYEEREITVSEHDILEFSENVKKETCEMHSFCTNVEENIPKEKDEFTTTTNQNICNYCNFRELCL